MASLVKVRVSFSKILWFLLPILHSGHANRIIESKMQSIQNGKRDFEYMAGYSSLTLPQAQQFYDKSLDQMKSLEDKARISMIGVTIAVSLVTGLAGLLSALGDADFVTPLKIIIVVFDVISLAYMGMSGWMSLVVLGEKNRVYQLFPKDMKLLENEKLKLIALYTELNVNLNIIRNNYIYAAYRSILYAIISLAIMFFITAVGTFCVDNTTSSNNTPQAQSASRIASPNEDGCSP